MSEFEKVIGYETIKEELLQICDMVHNKEAYDNLGAKFPKGILLHGEPGLGKTLMAKCFIKESGLTSYTLRKNKGDADFIDTITKAFEEAKKTAPCIIFIDDLDKFANEDDTHADAEEYVAVQAGIDEVCDSEVFVIATANNIHKLPESLLRSGRFDRKIRFLRPTNKDAKEIIKYYLSDKKVSGNVNMDDLTSMISYSSCAELETILNEAAIIAASKRRESIEMDDIVNAALHMQYYAPDDSNIMAPKELKLVAMHEAGHLVAAEVLMPEIVGLAYVQSSGRSEVKGLVHYCDEIKRRPFEVIISLAGKAAVELYYSETVANGCYDDLSKASDAIIHGVLSNATQGLSMLDVFGPQPMSESMKNSTETIVHAQLENFMIKAKDILLKNRDFLEKTAAALEEKEVLLASDIKAIKESTTITPVVV